MNWISIKDRMPQNSATQDVLCWHKENGCFMGKVIDGKWYLYFQDSGLQYDKYHSGLITHWQYLPESPKL